jgi:hypothetical protein
MKKHKKEMKKGKIKRRRGERWVGKGTLRPLLKETSPS